MVNLTSEQQAAAYANGSVVVTAGAGTEKTLMLAERYLYYLREKQLSPLEIVAVTFTEKAALELRSRIRLRVGALYQPLTASRSCPTSEQPFIQILTASKNSNTNKLQRQCLEAYSIAELLKNLIESQTDFFDQKTNQFRPIQPGDIAILTRTWEPLEQYGVALPLKLQLEIVENPVLAINQG